MRPDELDAIREHANNASEHILATLVPDIRALLAEVERLTEVASAAQAYVDLTGWAPLGASRRCIHCHAHLDDPDHMPSCRYQRLRWALDGETSEVTP